jgi:hypothetical protein
VGQFSPAISVNYTPAITAAATSAQNRAAFNEYAASSGLNSGAGGQAQLAMNNALQNNLTAIRTNQANAVSDAELALAKLKSQYQDSIAAAQKENDYEKAAALLSEYQAAAQSAVSVAAEQANEYYRAYQSQLANRQYGAEWDRASDETDYERSLAQAQTLAQYGDFSGYRSFGDAAYQSAASGGDVHEQMASGVENAAIQVLTEKLFGGNPAYDAQERGLVTDAIYAAANKLGGAEKLGAVLESVPAKMFGESMEEVIGDYLTPIADWARNGFKGDVQWPDAGNVAQDAAVAAGLSAVGLTANDIVGAAGGADVPEGAAQTGAHSAAQPSAEAGTVRPAGRTETSSGQTDARPSGATLYDAFMDEVNRNPQAGTSSPGGKSASDTSRQTNSVAAVINSLKTAVKSGDVDADTAASIANTLVNTVNPSAQTAAEGLKTGIDNAGKSGYSGIANIWNPITEGMDYLRGTATAPVFFAEPSENLDLDYIAGLLHEPIDGNSGTTATKAEAVNPQALENYVNRALAAQNKYIDKSVNAQSKFADKGAEAMNGYVDDAAERAAAINQVWDDYVNKSLNAQGGYADKGAKAMSGAVDQYAEGAEETTKEVWRVVNKLKKFKKFKDALSFVHSVNVSAFDDESLTKLIDEVNNISFKTTEKITLKSEIIRQAGFTNFDKARTLADVLGFTRIEITELKAPITLYRRGYPGESASRNGLGRWWGDKYRTIDQVRNDLAVCEEWGNPLTGEYSIIAPKGTRIIKGVAAPQTITDASGNIIEYRPGGGIQYWLNDIPNEWLN